LVGCSLGAYRLLAFRGEGGFGEVYLADQREPIRRRVAVKVLRERRDVDASLGIAPAARREIGIAICAARP
jgi:serine/threonine protein kinase